MHPKYLLQTVALMFCASLFLLLSSCENLLGTDEPYLKVTAQVSAKTYPPPIQQFSTFTLTATTSGGIVTLGGYDTYNTLTSTKIEVEEITYDILTLTAIYNEKTYTATVENLTVSSGKNSVKFTFKMTTTDTENTDTPETNGETESDIGTTAPDTDTQDDGKTPATETASYTVRFFFEAIDSDNYIEDSSLAQTLTGEPGDYTKVETPAVITGFTAQDFNQAIIAKNGSTVVEVRYTRNIITLRFVANGGSWSDGDSTREKTLSEKYGATVSVPSLEKAGSTFIGWNHTVQTTFTEDTLYTAQWRAITYTITFNANGGTFGGTATTAYQTAEYGLQALQTSSALSLSRAGYIFIGWTGNSSGSKEYADGTQVSVTGNTVLYALWEEVTPEVHYAIYTVKYLTQHVSGSEYEVFKTNELQGIVGNTVQAETFEIEGFTIHSAPSATVNANGTTMIEVKYNRKTITLTFTVAGNSSQTVSGRYGATVAQPSNPTRTGYTFKGWSSTVQTMFTENETYTALWEAKPYTVWYDFDETEENYKDFAVLYDETIVLKDASALGWQRTGYIFKGWTTTKGGTSVQYEAGETITITDDIDFFAVWEEIPATTSGITVTMVESEGDASIAYEDGYLYEDSDISGVHGALTFTWYIDGVKKENYNEGELYFTRASYSRGLHTVMVVITRKSDSSFYRSATALVEIQ